MFSVKNIADLDMDGPFAGGPGAGLIYTSMVLESGLTGGYMANVANGLGPFSLAFDEDDNLLVSEAFSTGPGTSGALSSYTLNPDGTVTTISGSVLSLEAASCWVAVAGDCAFTTNNFVASISSYSITDGALTLVDNEAATLDAPLDISVSPDGQFLYALSTGHNLAMGDTGPMGQTQGQPAIFSYIITPDCGLARFDVELEGLPTEFISVNGAVGMTSC